jgi:uncharacterized protein (TIGR04551 family)
MPRFPFFAPSLILAVLSVPSLAPAQQPSAPRVRPASAPSAPAPSSSAPAPSSSAPAAPSAPGGTAAPGSSGGSTPASGATTAPSLDRGALLEPSPSASPPPPAPPASSSSSATTAPMTSSGTAAGTTNPPASASASGALPVIETRDSGRRVDASIGADPKDVYAEDWWVHSRPTIELHGYFRVRAELFHGFTLGRTEEPAALWPQPLDNTSGSRRVLGCGDATQTCEDKSQAGANMRFRINPEFHLSDNLRILSQVDMFDNLTLGSTPAGYLPGNPGSDPYTPISGVANTQAPPTAGQNSLKNSIVAKRAWGEYATPVGQLRFGRMPSHWGLGILENSGDTYDSDWHSTVDRIMFTTGIKSLDLYVSGAWDFPSEGASSALLQSTFGGQPYDLAQLDDVNQYTAMVVRRRNPELAKLDLARGDVVVNGGAYFAYRDQLLANPTDSPISATDPSNLAYVLNRRKLRQYTPDLWLQILYRKFRFEAEGVMVAGAADTLGDLSGAGPFKIRQFGVATQTEYKAMEDRLRLQFGFGWSSGDAGLVPELNRTGTLTPARTTLPSRIAGDNTYKEFRFHPDYRIDLILNRNILGRVQGEYYFRPSVDYDFTRNAEGQKLGGGAALIWTRASEFVQTPGHKTDLGAELDFSVYYQSKDGALNDNPDKMGGFFTMLQYGVLFPLGGLSHLSTENPGGVPDTSTAHTLRWFIGILY